MSYIDSKALEGQLLDMEKAMNGKIMEAALEELAVTQREAAELAPRRTGKLAEHIMRPEAIKHDAAKGQATLQFVSTDKGAPWFAFVLEFGRNAYKAGGSRRAGKTRNGKQRFQKMKRNVGAMQATPFMRPAAANFARRMGDIRRVAKGKGVVEWLLNRG
jgi:hypothetical protein